MADYFTQFSCMLDVGTTENVTSAYGIFDALESELQDAEDADIGFELNTDSTQPGALWIRSDGYGEPDHVIAFVLRCAEVFDLGGRWGFVWSLTCSKARLDGFGGGAQLIDLGGRRSLAWLDCAHWLDMVREPGVDPTEGVGIV